MSLRPSIVDYEEYNWLARIWISNKIYLIGSFLLCLVQIMTQFIIACTFDKISTNKAYIENNLLDSCIDKP